MASLSSIRVESLDVPRAVRTARSWLYQAAILTAMLVAAFIAFSPGLNNEFVWEDGYYFVDNPHYRGFSSENLRWIFHDSAELVGNYEPVTWLTFALDYIFWGMDPKGYHLSSILLHLLMMLALYWAAKELFLWGDPVRSDESETSAIIGAAAGAVFFSLHPLRVQCVSWLVGRHYILAAFFGLLSLKAYLAMARVAGGARYVVFLACSLILYVLSLLSLPITVTFPILLLLLDILVLKRLDPNPRRWFSPSAVRIWGEKTLYVILSIATVISAIGARGDMNIVVPFESFGLPQRLLTYFWGAALYAWHTIVPLWLSPYYELLLPLKVQNPQYVMATLFFIAVSLFLIRHWARWPAVLAAWLSYAVVLLPTAGLVQSGPQMAAYRYAYVAQVGWAFLAGGGVRLFWKSRQAGRVSNGIFYSVLVTGLTFLVLIGGLSFRHVSVYRDNERLWQYTLSVAPECSYAYYFLGYTYFKAGDHDRAANQYREALRINPKYALAAKALGDIYSVKGDWEAGIEYYSLATRISPKYAKAEYNLGALLLKSGRRAEAARHFRRVLDISPRYLDAHIVLGLMALDVGDKSEAMNHFRRALQIDPKSKPALNGLHSAQEY
jgi:tetratricopeptide (TPR) repeat protein